MVSILSAHKSYSCHTAVCTFIAHWAGYWRTIKCCHRKKKIHYNSDDGILLLHGIRSLSHRLVLMHLLLYSQSPTMSFAIISFHHEWEEDRKRKSVCNQSMTFIDLILSQQQTIDNNKKKNNSLFDDEWKENHRHVADVLYVKVERKWFN